MFLDSRGVFLVSITRADDTVGCEHNVFHLRYEASTINDGILDAMVHLYSLSTLNSWLAWETLC